MPRFRVNNAAPQNGTPEDGIVLDVTGGYNGLVILSGSTKGNWTEANLGGNDFLAVMVDTNHTTVELENAPTSATSDTGLRSSLSPTSDIFVPTPVPAASSGVMKTSAIIVIVASV